MSNTLIDRQLVESLIEAEPNFTDAQLDMAVEMVRQCCGWHIAPVVSETITVDGDGSSLLGLPTLRLADLVSCTIDGVEVTDVEWSTNGLLERSCGFPRKRRSVVVEIEHGHAGCPDDVAGVIIAIAARMPFTTGGDGVEVGVIEEQLGSYRYRLTDSIQTDGYVSDVDLFVLGKHRVAPQA